MRRFLSVILALAACALLAADVDARCGRRGGGRSCGSRGGFFARWHDGGCVPSMTYSDSGGCASGYCR